VGLESSLAKIDRAKKHIVELDAAIDTFLKADLNKVGTKRDPQSREPVYYLVSVADIPVEVAAITGDIIHNLRSALDHLAYQLVFMNTNGLGIPGKLNRDPFRNVYFPIGDCEERYITAKASREVKAMGQKALDAIDSIKPYKGGEDLLWQLHKLDNTDKHRLVITVSSGLEGLDNAPILKGVYPETTKVPGLEFKWGTYPTGATFLCPLKAGDVLFTDLPDAEVQEEVTFSFDVALHEPGVIECKPLRETVKEMADLVSNIIYDFRSMIT
jgi:hypothetical protein